MELKQGHMKNSKVL